MRTITLICLCWGLLPGMIGTAHAQPSSSRLVSINISSRPLGDALAEFGKQAKLTVVFYAEDLGRNKNSRSLTGTFTAEAALEKLLSDTGLSYEYLDERTVAIRSAKSGSSSLGSRPADQMRVAAVDDTAPAAGSHDSSGRRVDGTADMTVEDTRIQPFSDRNVDLPRTVNDVQAYYIFDAETIRRSAALSVDDFLKNYLTMNTVVQSQSQMGPWNGNVRGNTSTMNLRGLGRERTLVLVNGRRRASMNVLGYESQPDLNDIPPGAIDRIEVLPASSSGIYGGSAMAGVVNVILKKAYVGGEFRADYDNTWDTDAPYRTLSANYGQSLEHGRTQLFVSAQYSDGKSLLVQDRREVIQRGIETVMRNQPSLLISSSGFQGATPNISNRASGPLVFDDGTSLGSNVTHIPAGLSPSATPEQLRSALIANAGSFNLDLPLSNQYPTGLLTEIGVTPTVTTLSGSLRRKFTERWEGFLEFSAGRNESTRTYNPITSGTILADAPNNPFNSDIYVYFPSLVNQPYRADSTSKTLTIGAIGRLPFGWTAEFDYTRSENEFHTQFAISGTDLSDDIRAGAVNILVDTAMFLPDLTHYWGSNTYDGVTRLHDLALRGAGSVFTLPWGTATMALGLQHRISRLPESVTTQHHPNRPENDSRWIQFGRSQETSSGYAELQMPLVTTGRIPLLHALDLQVSARTERFTVDTGTSARREYPNNPEWPTTYDNPVDENGQPFQSEASYSTRNWTLGLKYEPVPGVILRVSQASAFVPPTPDQLVRHPVPPSWAISQISDPDLGISYPVSYRSGGNPDLIPENSKSMHAGVIWQPRAGRMQGLRLNAEWYRLTQFDRIGTLNPQQIIDSGAFPERIERDPVTGRIDVVDTSYLNLTEYQTEGWDVTLDYQFNTRWGRFYVRAAETYIVHEYHQPSVTQPRQDFAGFVAEGGPAKRKANASLTWERGGLIAGWTLRYFGSYHQQYAPGSPLYTRSPNAAQNTLWTDAQGGYIIPSQPYHDLFVSYDFGAAGAPGGAGWQGLLRNTLLHVGVKNVFNEYPPFDAAYGNTRWGYYASPFGDLRLRSYVISLRTRF